MPTHYYGIEDGSNDQHYRGVVYHWNEKGTEEIYDHKTQHRETEELALNDAAEWCEENNIDAEME